MLEIDFLIPGDISTLTGGYTYDREVAAGLNAAGFEVTIRQIGEDLQDPAAHAHAAQLITRAPDQSLVLIDGLALAPLADLLLEASSRLRMIALVHHPAALETGLSTQRSAEIARAEAAALHAMQGIICTSAWTAAELSRSGVPPEKIDVVEPGVDAALLRAGGNTRRRTPARAHAEGLHLICVATLTPRKGHAQLIAALAQLSDLRWRLDCIGSLHRDRACASQARELVARHNLTDRIRFLGELDHESLAEHYHRADAFVLASRLEGYGIVFAEASAAGLPVIATRGGAVEDTLANAAGIVVDSESHHALAAELRKLMTDKKYWIAMSRHARQHAQTVRSWQQVTTEFANILTSERSR